MKIRFELNVLQPRIEACTENWENMLPHEKGAYCRTCHKVVNDISRLSKEEFDAFLLRNQDNRLCCRVNDDQLHHSIAFLNTIPEQQRTHFRFAVALFLIFGVALFSCNEEDHKKVGDAITAQVLNSEDSAEIINSVVETDTIIKYEEANDIPNIIKPNTDSDTVVTVCNGSDTLPAMTITSKLSTEIQYHVAGALVVTRIIKYIDTDTTTLPVAELINTDIEKMNLFAYPNPAINSVTINYIIKNEDFSLLSLYNLSGQKITDIVNESISEPGKYTKSLDTSVLPAGTYLLILLNGTEKEVFKLMVTR